MFVTRELLEDCILTGKQWIVAAPTVQEMRMMPKDFDPFVRQDHITYRVVRDPFGREFVGTIDSRDPRGPKVHINTRDLMSSDINYAVQAFQKLGYFNFSLGNRTTTTAPNCTITIGTAPTQDRKHAMKRQVSTDAFRSDPAAILEEVGIRGTVVEIAHVGHPGSPSKHPKPIAVLMRIDEYEKLTRLRDRVASAVSDSK